MAERILIADDSATVRKLVRGVLQFRGYEIVEATTGDEALQAIEAQAPDIAILDLRMPGKDGLDVLRQVREMEGKSAGAAGPVAGRKPLPVIILTAEEEEHEQARDAGASRYLVKPFKPVELLNIVGELLSSLEG
jgi:CheY-like chemotaxis protein